MKMRKIKKLTSVILALLILTSCAPAGAGNVSSALIGEWVFAAGVIPENNPKPVLVNREDAATPTPISYTDKIVGEEMDVEVKQLKIHTTLSREWKHHIAVIRSYDELKEIAVQDVKEFDDREDYSNFYNKEHFNNNVVIMLFKSLGYGRDQFSIEKVTKSRGKMQIYLKQNSSTVMPVAAYLRIFISVPKEEMEGIKSAVVFREAYSYVY